MNRAAYRILLCLAPFAVMFWIPAGSAAAPLPLYHVVGASVHVDWSYDYSGTDDDNDPFTEAGSEVANLSFAKATLKSDDVLGVYTAALSGTDSGQYAQSGPGVSVSCAYALDPTQLAAQLQLNVVPLSHGRLEVNAGLSEGGTPSSISAFSDEVQQADNSCDGYTPTAIGSSLSYAPAPDNARTPQCRGIADGCAIFSARSFRQNTVTVSISDTVPVDAAGTAVPPDHTGQETYAWTIDATLKKG